uniref:Uncharacterized protein n=1 Tax=viral metagenome TaxID=1070528 RepID=A0A6M3L6S1_9ZZZZ
MKWRTKTPPARPYDVLESGPVRLSISDAEGNPSLRWKYCTLTLGYHTSANYEKCLRDWPREALAKARAALDQFEAEIGGEENVVS